MADDSGRPEVQLQRAYALYRTATTAWHAAALAGADTEQTAERLLQARVELYRALVGAGWVAPAAVEVQLERDAALVAATSEVARLLTP